MELSAQKNKDVDPRNLPGSLKIAILVRSLNQAASQNLLNALSDQERDAVYQHLTDMGPISPALAENIAREFAERMRQFQKEKQSEQPGEENAMPPD